MKFDFSHLTAKRVGIPELPEKKPARSEIVILEIPRQEQSRVSDADVFKTIGDILEKTWLDLTDNMTKELKPEFIPEWVDTLEMALRFMPTVYAKQREIIKSELSQWRA